MVSPTLCKNLLMFPRRTIKSSMDIHPRLNILILIGYLLSKVQNIICNIRPTVENYSLPTNVLYIFRNWSLGSNIHDGILDAWNYQHYFRNLRLAELPNSVSYLNHLNPTLEQFTDCQYILIDVRSLFVSAYFYQIPKCLIETFLVGIKLRQQRIIPIVLCPDYEQISDRLLGILVAGNYGYFLSMGQDPSIVQNSPHSRVVGPIAVFNKRLLTSYVIPTSQRRYDLFIGGSIYGRRGTDYTYLKEYFEYRGYNVLFKDKSELTYALYLDSLKNSKITYVSSFHSSDPNILCAMGKVSEAASLGCVPCTQRGVAISQWFSDGKDYIGIDPLASLDKIASSIDNVLLNPDLLQTLSSSCVSKARSLAYDYNLWNQIYTLIRQNNIRNSYERN